MKIKVNDRIVDAEDVLFETQEPRVEIWLPEEGFNLVIKTAVKSVVKWTDESGETAYHVDTALLVSKHPKRS